MQREEEKIFRRRCELFCNRIKNDFYGEEIILEAEYALTDDAVKFEDRLNLEYKPLREGDHWGDKWQSAWVHLKIDIPEEWRNREIGLHFNSSGEALFFDKDGCPYYSLTGSNNFIPRYLKDFYLFNDEIKQRGCADLWIELAGNAIFGMDMSMEPSLREANPRGVFEGMLKCMRLSCFNKEVWHLFFDYYTLYQIFAELPAEDYRSRRLHKTLHKIIDVYAENPANAAAARVFAAKELAYPAFASAMTAVTIGHAHLDTGWLWPVKESVRKSARTFAAQIDLIEKYPEYIFGASAPQHYQFVKDNYPLLYEKIKKAVADGRWELQGGMWVEADCNLISGESMVRQFVHGKNFFMDEFGVDVKNLWIPDVFGYSGALPQITKKSGCDYFLTQKISWNQVNRFPYHTFRWKGIDGTEILTHFPPADNYCCTCHPTELKYAENRYHESAETNKFMFLIGIGDGGCGPAEEYVERALRMKNLEGCSKVEFGRADEFFEDINKVADELPVWTGELYLEMHRGTYTTQSRTKRNNRKLEQLLTAAEFLCASLDIASYPAEKFDKLWKTLLLNQFHDIIPGSSIAEVYETTEKEHKQMFETLRTIISDAASFCGEKDANSMLLVNSLSYGYDRCIELDDSWKDFEIFCDGKELAVQNINGKVFVKCFVPSFSSIVITKGAAKVHPTACINEKIIENDFVRYVFNDRGEIVEAFDKQFNRNILRQNGVGNSLSLYVDRPVVYEAWDVDSYYRDGVPAKAFDVEFSPVECGSLGKSTVIKGKIGNSTFTQTVFLANDSKRLDFNTVVDWQEDRKMLRVGFGVDVFANEANFDIQYGYLKRPIAANTSWDMARFEVIGHRYMDISERNYGVALLNDCKYGYRCDDTGLDLCLLRSPKYPDYYADRGTQEFKYSLLPHCGDIVASDVMKEAALLNREVIQLPAVAEKLISPVSFCGENVTLEVVKKAEKSNKIVCRLVESAGAGGKGKLTFNTKVTRAAETDLLEWHEEKVYDVANQELELTFKPFEIKTIVF